MNTETPKEQPRKSSPSEKIAFAPLHGGMGFHTFSEGLPYAQTPQPLSAPIAPRRPPPPGVAPTLAAPLISPLRETVQAPPVTEFVSIQEDCTSRRMMAYLLDTIFHAGFWILSNLWVLFTLDIELNFAVFELNPWDYLALFLLSQGFFIALQETLFGNSLGKYLLNLGYISRPKSFLFRSLIVSVGIGLGGILLLKKPQDHFGKIG